MVPTHVPAVFVGVEIDDIIDQGVVNPTISEHGSGFCCRTIGDDAFVVVLDLGEYLQSGSLDALYPAGEAAIVIDVPNAQLLFFAQELKDRCALHLLGLHKHP